MELSGLGSPWRVRTLLELVRLHNPGLVFISQTKSNYRRYKAIKQRLNFFGLGVASRGRGGGLLLLWRKDVEVWVQSYSPHHIYATGGKGV
ncbi:UNVERIFIED_CONTAM: hypothetical protein Slati_3843500 [Sesamum latifolium]|uniref:Uncharacterized protein n=1 Tax=Sesamum latifolium TaxID=2727402 RepID=A0AAW2TNU2_9LAMI